MAHSLGRRIREACGGAPSSPRLAQTLRFRTSVDEWVEAGPENPIRVVIAPDTREPRPYILVRSGLEALILRPVYYHLAELAVEHDPNGVITLGVWSNKAFFPLGYPD